MLERLECKRLSLLKDSVVRGPAAPKVHFVEMRISYATDRLRGTKEEKSASKDWTRYYSGDTKPDFKDFAFDKVAVTVGLGDLSARRAGLTGVAGKRL